MTDGANPLRRARPVILVPARKDAEVKWLAARRVLLLRGSLGKALLFASAFGGGLFLNVGGRHPWLRVVQITLGGCMAVLLIVTQMVAGNALKRAAKECEERDRHFFSVLDEP